MRVKKFTLEDLFISQNGNVDLKKEDLTNSGAFLVTAGLENCGIAGKTDKEATIFPPNTITVDMFGNAFFRDYPYKMVTHARVFSLLPLKNISREVGLYLTSLLNFLPKLFSYDNMCSWTKIKNIKLSLPVKTVFSPDYALIENLAGGGIDMSNIDTSTWKEFKLTDIFELQYGNKFDKNKMTFINPTVNFVSRTANNNGISAYVDRIDDVEPYPAGCLTLAFGGSIGSCFVQSQPFYTGQNVGIIKLPDGISEKAAQFIACCIEKKCKNMYITFSDEINKHFKTDLSILLPCTETEEIDFEYMENYISELEAERISELEAYLKVTGLDDYELTEVDKLALTLKPQLKEFKVEDIFEKIETTKLPYKAADYKDWSLKNGIPATTSGLANQGLTACVPRNGAVILKNCITIASNGDAGTAFYQPEEFTILQDSYAIQYKSNVIQTPKAEHYLYAVAALNKGVKPLYSYTNKAVWNKVRNDKILLPCTEGKEIDFTYMEKYIRAKEKQTIVKVYEGSGKIIEKTKEIVSDYSVVSA